MYDIHDLKLQQNVRGSDRDGQTMVLAIFNFY